MNTKIDIYKSAGVLLRDRQLLVTRSKGKDFFIAPGGKRETGETAREALQRELREELQIDIDPTSLETLGTFHALATGHEDVHLKMDVFIVPNWDGEITPAAEVAEVRWINSLLPTDMNLGSIFHHDVIPLLKGRDLID